MTGIYNDILDDSGKIRPGINFVTLLNKWNNKNYYEFLGVEPGTKGEPLSEEKKEFLLKNLSIVSKNMGDDDPATKMVFDETLNVAKQVQAVRLLFKAIKKATDMLYYPDSKKQCDETAYPPLTDLRPRTSVEYETWWYFVKNVHAEPDIERFIRMNKAVINANFNRENFVYHNNATFCNPLRTALDAYTSNIFHVKHLLLAGAKLPENIHGLETSVQENIFDKLGEIIEKIKPNLTRAQFISILVTEPKIVERGFISLDDLYNMFFKNPMDAEKPDLIRMLQNMEKSLEWEIFDALEIFKLAIDECNTACIALMPEALRTRPALKQHLVEATKKEKLDLPDMDNASDDYCAMLQMLINSGFIITLTVEQQQTIERNAKLAAVVKTYRSGPVVGKVGQLNTAILDKKPVTDDDLLYANGSTFICAILAQNALLVGRLIDKHPLLLSGAALSVALLTSNQDIIKKIVKALPLNHYPHDIEQILSICTAETKQNVPLKQYKSAQFHLAQSRSDEKRMEEALKALTQLQVQPNTAEQVQAVPINGTSKFSTST